MTSADYASCQPYCDFEWVLNPRRAVILCAQCHRDVSMEYLFWYEAMEGVKKPTTVAVGKFRDGSELG
jgi:hypothetical protein